jgi:hypothetical protein
MSTKLVYLKTGEYVITEILEGRDEDRKVIGYIFNNPKQIIAGSDSDWGENNTQIQIKVSLLTWPQFTKDTRIEVFPDAMITAVDPTEELLKLYEESFNAKT